MAKQQPVARKQSPSKRDERQEADRGTGENGHEEEVARYEQELAAYLQERIKPGLNSGAIPLLARSIAKAIAHGERPNGASQDAEVVDEPAGEADDEPGGEADDEPGGEADDEPGGEADDEPGGEADDEPGTEAGDEPTAKSEAPPDFESDMHECQAKLGEDWILSFSVHGDDGWLTAEKDDGRQRLEAQTAAVLLEAVELLNEGGGRSS